MIVRELNNEECLRSLTGTRLARLACARENQPYVVPVYLAYHEPPADDPCFYGFTTLGQKVAWMRANPHVCVEIDEITSSSRWTSVIVFGRYEELPDLPEHNIGYGPAREMTDRLHREAIFDAQEPASERLVAHQLLQTRGIWWEPASTARVAHTPHKEAQPFVPIYYKIVIDQVTGREAMPDFASEESAAALRSGARQRGGLRRVLRRLFKNGRA